ncbi:malic enzyme-like NAD(P)-binding protein [Rhodopila sp.]|uniref:malic enzyme-like NAD(P)-binding protein n=1 Tax=Rhodopila sp. TaxID=2480087 RepID=UPI003D0B5290
MLRYNDDIHGTPSVSIAGLTTALQISDMKLKDQRIFFLGAGSAGIGIANMIVEAMVAHKAMNDDLTLKQAAVQSGEVSEQQFEEMVDARKLVGSGLAGA